MKILLVINSFILHSTIFPLKNYLKLPQIKERKLSIYIKIGFKFKWFLLFQEKNYPKAARPRRKPGNRRKVWNAGREPRVTNRAIAECLHISRCHHVQSDVQSAPRQILQEVWLRCLWWRNTRWRKKIATRRRGIDLSRRKNYPSKWYNPVRGRPAIRWQIEIN